MKFSDVMIDIETMGQKSDAAIISIAAVEFNMETGETGKEFNMKVDLQSSLDIGLKIDASTLLWWMKQDDNARKGITEKGEYPHPHIIGALNQLSKFISKDQLVWGNSARFDLGILQTAYSKTNTSIPWNFRNERDVRTLVSFAPEIKKQMVFKGVRHDALDDCKHQIKYCSAIWNSFNRK